VSGYGFLRQRRWLALGFLVVLVLPSFLLLSRWQVHRLEERRAANQLVIDHSSQTPVPVTQVMASGAPLSSVGDAQRWIPVTATGHYDDARTQLVRKRPLDSRPGFWVATPLVLSDGTELVVNRGWLEASGSATVVQAPPAAPTGLVTVTGRVQPSEDAPDPQPSDLPAGQITDLSVPLVSGGGAAAFPGYIDLMSSTPPDSAELTPIALPDLSEGPHLGYAVQWVLFAIVAVVGFVVLVRRERQYGAAADDAAAVPATEASTSGPADA